MEKMEANREETDRRIGDLEAEMREKFADTTPFDRLQEQLDQLHAATAAKDYSRIEAVEAWLSTNSPRLDHAVETLGAIDSFLKHEKKIVSKIQGQGEKSLGKNISSLDKRVDKVQALSSTLSSKQHKESLELKTKCQEMDQRLTALIQKLRKDFADYQEQEKAKADFFANMKGMSTQKTMAKDDKKKKDRKKLEESPVGRQKTVAPTKSAFDSGQNSKESLITKQSAAPHLSPNNSQALPGQPSQYTSQPEVQI